MKIEEFDKILNNYNISVEVEQNKYSELTNFQLGNYLLKLESDYYKLVLVNKIIDEINKGTQLEDIFIFDSSYNLDNIYKNLKNINLENEKKIEAIYHRGNIISLHPNSFFEYLNVIFDFFRNINSKINSRKAKLPKSLLIAYFNQLSDNASLLNLIKILNNITKNINKQYINKNVDLEEMKQRYIEKIKKYEQDSIYIDAVKKTSIKKLIEIGEYDKEKLQQSYDTYFSRFGVLFRKLHRPIVGVIRKSSDNKYHKIDILSIEYINKKEKFIIYKSLSHQSPWKICLDFIINNYIFASYIIIALIAVNALNRKENDNLIEFKETEGEYIKNRLKEIPELKDINVNDLLKNINDTKSYKLEKENEIISEIYDETDQSVKKSMKRYKFFVQNIKFIKKGSEK